MLKRTKILPHYNETEYAHELYYGVHAFNKTTPDAEHDSVCSD